MANSYKKISAKQIAKMSAGTSISESGIVVSKSLAGNVKFSISVMVDGARIHRTVGRAIDGVSRADAERLIERLRTEAREGRLKLQKNRKLAMSFAEVSTLYVSAMEAAGGKNIARKKQHIKSHLLPAFGALRIDALTTSKVAAFAHDLKTKKKLSPATVNRYLATLSHIFSVAASKDNGWVSQETLPEIEITSESRGRTVTLSGDEQLRLLVAAKEDSEPQLYLFVLTGLESSGRHTEILKHQWDNFLPDRRRIFVPEAKAGAREQPLTTGLTRALLAERERQRNCGLLSPDGYVFLPHPRSKKAYRVTFRSAFRRAVIRAGMDPSKITPHIMRHTAITDLVTAGVSLPTAQIISGHKTIKMLLHYYHASDRSIDQAVDVLSTK